MYFSDESHRGRHWCQWMDRNQHRIKPAILHHSHWTSTEEGTHAWEQHQGIRLTVRARFIQTHGFPLRSISCFIFQTTLDSNVLQSKMPSAYCSSLYTCWSPVRSLRRLECRSLCPFRGLVDGSLSRSRRCF